MSDKNRERRRLQKLKEYTKQRGEAPSNKKKMSTKRREKWK